LDIHTIYMQRCLELAQNGLGATRANPLVGCVVTKDNKIIAEGYHRLYGGSHAEAEALKKLDNSQLESAIVYVNLEPCSHQGKTPPCADLLISKGAKHVVVASVDPNPLVAGKGLARLAAAGIKIDQGVLDNQNREINRRFFTFHEKKRPYIILKWAQSVDGYIAPVRESKYKLTGMLANMLVHEWRSQETGILVGRRTVEKDNPLLTVRLVSGVNPLRIIMDPQCRLNREHEVFNADASTVILNTVKQAEEKNVRFVKLSENGFLAGAVRFLHEESIVSVLVEGGTETLRQFIEAGLWDEARIFTCPKKLEKGLLAPVIKGKQKTASQVGEDDLTILIPAS